MAVTINTLQGENEKLKNKILLLEKEISELKTFSSASPIKHIINRSSSRKSRKHEKNLDSTLEKNLSKDSWSKFITSDFETIKDIKISQSKTPSSVKGKSDKALVEPQALLQELSMLKSENRELKVQLKRQRLRSRRSENEKSLEFRDAAGGSVRNKHCEVCSKLLAKGFTTKYCPLHGYPKRLFTPTYMNCL